MLGCLPSKQEGYRGVRGEGGVVESSALHGEIKRDRKNKGRGEGQESKTFDLAAKVRGLVRLSHEANGRAGAGEGSNRVRKGKFLRKIRDTHRNVQLKMQQGVIIDDQACSEHVRGEREWRVSVGSGLRAEGGHIWDKGPEK